MDQDDSQRSAVGAWLVKEGWHVVGADGAKVGEVEGIRSNCLVVSRGIFLTTERFVPVSAIRTIEDDRVYLDVTKDEIEARGWDVEPISSSVATDISLKTETDIAGSHPPAV